MKVRRKSISLKSENDNQTGSLYEVEVNGVTILVDPRRPLTVSEFVYLTGHSESYFYAMKKSGFPLYRRSGERCQTATYAEYLEFFKTHPDFTFDRIYRPKLLSNKALKKWT